MSAYLEEDWFFRLLVTSPLWRPPPVRCWYFAPVGQPNMLLEPATTPKTLLTLGTLDNFSFEQMATAQEAALFYLVAHRSAQRSKALAAHWADWQPFHVTDRFFDLSADGNIGCRRPIFRATFPSTSRPMLAGFLQKGWWANVLRGNIFIVAHLLATWSTGTLKLIQLKENNVKSRAKLSSTQWKLILSRWRKQSPKIH